MTRLRAPLAAALLFAAAHAAAESRVVRIDGSVQPAHARWLEDALRAATREPGSVTLIVDARGGRLDAAVRMRDALVRAEIPTTCLVLGQAIDETALACLGASRVELARGARIDFAEPLRTTPDASETRRIDRLRVELLATLRARGRTVGTLADAIDVAAPQGESAPMPRTLAVAACLAGPLASGLLLAFGLLGVLTEVRHPVRVPGVLGLIALGLFFAAHGIAGLAGWPEATLGALGLVLLAIEIFVLPGFGACGMLGLLLFGAGVLLALAGHDPQLAMASGALRMALLVAGSAALATGVGLAALLHVAPAQVPAGRGPRP